VKPSEINLLTTQREHSVLTTFSLAALEAAFWDDVARQSAQRGRPDVSPFSRKVAASVFDACLWALRDRQTDNRVHRTLAASTGSGKSSAAACFVSALLKAGERTSVLYVSPDVRQADDTYRELSKLIDPEDIAIWTGGHDAGSTLEVIRSKHDGFEPAAPRFKKAQLESYRVAIISHSWYLSTQGVHGALSYDGQPRTLHLIDERLPEVKLSDLGLADVIDARDTVISQRGDKDPLACATAALAVYMDHVWGTERATPGSAFRAIGGADDSLAWFMTDEAASEERRAFSQKKVADAIAFGRSLVTGHAFMARYQQSTKGGRFVSYKLELPRIAGSALLDASSDIDGVTALSPWRALVTRDCRKSCARGRVSIRF
jgi:hypothetical protein